MDSDDIITSAMTPSDVYSAIRSMPTENRPPEEDFVPSVPRDLDPTSSRADTVSTEARIRSDGFDNFLIIDRNGKATLDRTYLVDWLKYIRIVYCNGYPYRYNGRTYERITEEEVAKMVYDKVRTNTSSPFVTRNTVKDILGQVRCTSTPDVLIERYMQSLRYDGANHDDDPDYSGTLIPFANGLYSIEEDDLLPYTPLLFFDRMYDAVYDPRVTESEAEGIYTSIIPDEGTREFFYEMVGYIVFHPSMSPPAIFLVYGPGETGKTALQMAITAVIGHRNVSSLDLSQISSQFGPAGMVGKVLNVCGETGTGHNKNAIDRVDGELLKRLSDGQTIQVDRKYSDPIEVENRAKMMFVSNSLPDFGDSTSGLYRRLYIIPCRRHQRWEDQIYSKMQTPEALSWLVNKALVGYHRFLGRGCTFAPSREMELELRHYRRQDSLGDFLEWMIGSTDKDKVAEALDGELVNATYEAYKDYIRDVGGHPVTMRKFSEAIRNEYNMETVNKYINNNGKRTSNRMFRRSVE